MEFEGEIYDYEHEGDFIHEKSIILKECPEAANFKFYEEEDFEAEQDYEEEYGELDENIYKGFIEFEAPEKYKEILRELEYYPKN